MIELSGFKVLGTSILNAQRERTRRLLKCHGRSIQKTLYLQYPLSNTVRFVPVNLSSAKRSVVNPNGRFPFEFSPTFAPVPLSEMFQSFDRLRPRAFVSTRAESTFRRSIRAPDLDSHHDHALGAAILDPTLHGDA